jgi:GH35 family endo-1,4-beta-xylanase
LCTFLGGSLGLFAGHAFGQVTDLSLNPIDAVIKMAGTTTPDGQAWNLWSSGYVGTFLRLDQPGDVQVTISAAGDSALGVAPLMNLRLDGGKESWSVADPSYQDYTATFHLPAGTYPLRTEFTNDYYDAGQNLDRNLRLQSFGVTAPASAGLTLVNPINADGSRNASELQQTVFDAADTYIENHRKGSARVTLQDAGGQALAAGTAVHVKLNRHSFNFGTAVAGLEGPGWEAQTLMRPTPAPGSDAEKYQQAVASHFNMLVPENAGKWASNEAVRDQLTMGYLDQILDFAQAHNMRARYHTALWGAQQPDWAVNLENAALAGDMAARDDLWSAINSRIGYIVGDRSTGYVQIDGINENYDSHQPVFLNIFGHEGVAQIYNNIIDTARSAGSSTDVYFNDYNVLAWDADQYAQWYRQHMQSIMDAGITLENQQKLGIGIQYYTNGSGHDPTRIYQTLLNLGDMERPMALTEFGTDDPGNSPRILADTMRLVFGSPQANGFLMWGFWRNAMWMNGAALFDENWNLTDTGRVYEQMLDIHDWGIEGLPMWTTDLTLYTDASGQIDFRGFLGDYDLTVDSQSLFMSLNADGLDIALNVPEPGVGALLMTMASGLLLRRRRGFQVAAS